MKKIVFTLALISMAGIALFAEGSQEENTFVPGSGYMGRDFADQENDDTNIGPMGRRSNNPNGNYQEQMPMRRGMNAAEGSWESSGKAYPMGNANSESLTLTGKIDLTDVNLPKLTVGEETYELMVPYRLDYDIDIKDGDEITINGFEVPAYRRTSNPESTNLMVTGATFNGKDYNLDIPDNGPMAYNQKGDMMDNHGPVNGRQGKSGRFNNSRFSNNSRNCDPQQSEGFNRPYGRR